MVLKLALLPKLYLKILFNLKHLQHNIIDHCKIRYILEKSDVLWAKIIIYSSLDKTLWT